MISATAGGCQGGPMNPRGALCDASPPRWPAWPSAGWRRPSSAWTRKATRHRPSTPSCWRAASCRRRPSGRTRPPRVRSSRPTDRANAAGNGIPGPRDRRPTSPTSPSRASATWSPAGGGTWWALSDNGYGTRQSSPDWQLAIYRLDPRFGNAAGPQVLSDGRAERPPPARAVEDRLRPDRRRPPAVRLQRPAGAGRRRATAGAHPHRLRLRPGVARGRLRRHLLARRRVRPVPAQLRPQGRLLAPPYASAYKAPQNPTLAVLSGEKPVVGQSRGLGGSGHQPRPAVPLPAVRGAPGRRRHPDQPHPGVRHEEEAVHRPGDDAPARVARRQGEPGGAQHRRGRRHATGLPGLRGAAGDGRLRPGRPHVDQRPPAAVPRAGRPRRRRRRRPASRRSSCSTSARPSSGAGS